MKGFFASVAFMLVLMALAAMPVLWAISVMRTCGWMGFFVECRITAPQR